MRNDNFYVTHGWMINDLGLSGIELDVYAIIYGFSQDGKSEFTGSVKCLEEWTGKTKKTIIETLKSLVSKGYIKKRECEVANHIKIVSYMAVRPDGENYTGGVKNTPGRCKNCTGGGVKITPNNKDNINNNIYKNIVELLNAEAGTSYRYSTAKTRSLINSRLAEGFTVEDFETVIKKKVQEWKGTDMERYLRPETLFGTKFESYLNQSISNRPQAKTSGFVNYTGRNTDYDELIRKGLV